MICVYVYTMLVRIHSSIRSVEKIGTHQLFKSTRAVPLTPTACPEMWPVRFE